MLKKIIGTTGTRILNAVFNLVILLLITNYIGSEGLGIIGLILVDITIIQLSVDLVAGSSLIYFASRSNNGQLLLTAYIYIAIVIAVFYFLSLVISGFFPVLFYTIVPEGFIHHILALALLGSLMTTHYNLLLGKGRIATYNIIFTIQITIFLVVFTSLIFSGNTSVYAYLFGLYFAYGIAAIIGFWTVISKAGKLIISGWGNMIRQVIKYGFVTQLANLLSIGNNRMSYFFIKYFTGLPALGIYTAGIQLTEGLKLVGQSIAVVQFSTISNTRDINYARKLTIRLMKVSLVLTISALAVLLVLPGDFYTWLFSDDFIGIKPVIIALSPGVVALAANNIYSHYFSGMGNPKVNLFAKIVGFIFTVILAILLIPPFGFIGAAITASVSYSTTVIYQYMVFKKQTNTRFAEWIPVMSDLKDFRQIVKDSLKSEKDEVNK